jgi:hypothetical protein
MGFFRRSQTMVGWLALLALCFQLTVSFGHVHAVSAAGPGLGQSIASGSPSDPQNHADDLCPICVLTSLLASAAPCGAPALAPPPVLAGTALLPLPAVARAEPRLAAFRSRAPPLA